MIHFKLNFLWNYLILLWILLELFIIATLLLLNSFCRSRKKEHWTIIKSFLFTILCLHFFWKICRICWTISLFHNFLFNIRSRTKTFLKRITNTNIRWVSSSFWSWKSSFISALPTKFQFLRNFRLFHFHILITSFMSDITCIISCSAYKRWLSINLTKLFQNLCSFRFRILIFIPIFTFISTNTL